MQWYYKFRGETAADKFELQLAILNAYGEVGDVDKCHAVLTEMLTQNPNMPMLVTWGYNALLKAYRCILHQLSVRHAYRAHKIP